MGGLPDGVFPARRAAASLALPALLDRVGVRLPTLVNN
jgi:hypothetical protein